jgi:hypothetical protein
VAPSCFANRHCQKVLLCYVYCGLRSDIRMGRVLPLAAAPQMTWNTMNIKACDCYINLVEACKFKMISHLTCHGLRSHMSERSLTEPQIIHEGSLKSKNYTRSGMPTRMCWIINPQASGGLSHFILVSGSYSGSNSFCMYLTLSFSTHRVANHLGKL